MKAFTDLHVAFKTSTGEARPALDVATDLADAFAKLPEGAARTTAAMGIFGRAGASLIPVLSGGSAELRKLFTEAEDLGGILSNEFVKNADDAGDAIDRFKFATRGAKMAMAADFLPVITRFVTWASKMAARFHKLVDSTNLVQYATVALGVVAALSFGKVAMAVLRLTGVLTKGATGARALGQAFGFVGTRLVPLLLIAAAVEDIYGWITGADSATGRFLKSILGAEEADTLLKNVQATVIDLYVAFTSAGGAIKDLWDKLFPGVGFGRVFAGVLEGIVRGITLVLTGLGGVAKVVTSLISGDFAGAGKAIADAATTAGKALGVQDIAKGFMEAQDVQAHVASIQRGFDAGPTPGSAGFMGPAQVAQTNTVAITIQGNATPEAVQQVKGAVVDALGTHTKQAAAALGK